MKRLFNNNSFIFAAKESYFLMSANIRKRQLMKRALSKNIIKCAAKDS